MAATVLGLTVAVRIRLFGIPLARDEGEHAYASQLMLQGIQNDVTPAKDRQSLFAVMSQSTD